MKETTRIIKKIKAADNTEAKVILNSLLNDCFDLKSEELKRTKELNKELLEACQLASAAIKSYQMRLPKSAIWEQDNKDLEIIKKAIAKAEGK